MTTNNFNQKILNENYENFWKNLYLKKPPTISKWQFRKTAEIILSEKQFQLELKIDQNNLIFFTHTRLRTKCTAYVFSNYSLGFKAKYKNLTGGHKWSFGTNLLF